MNPILAGLLKLARRIGRWLLDVAARRGGAFLVGYIEERVGVFRARLARVSKRTTAAAKRRALWLKGRIARWLAAAKWLKDNAAGVDDRAIDAVRKLPAFAKLPASAPEETEPAAA